MRSALQMEVGSRIGSESDESFRVSGNVRRCADLHLMSVWKYSCRGQQHRLHAKLSGAMDVYIGAQAGALAF